MSILARSHAPAMLPSLLCPHLVTTLAGNLMVVALVLTTVMPTRLLVSGAKKWTLLRPTSTFLRPLLTNVTSLLVATFQTVTVVVALLTLGTGGNQALVLTAGLLTLQRRTDSTQPSLLVISTSSLFKRVVPTTTMSAKTKATLIKCLKLSTKV